MHTEDYPRLASVAKAASSGSARNPLPAPTLLATPEVMLTTDAASLALGEVPPTIDILPLTTDVLPLATDVLPLPTDVPEVDPAAKRPP